MAISYVGDVVVDSNENSPYQFTYTSAGGNTLILSGAWFTGATVNTGISGISDSAGNTWHYSTSDAASPPSQHNLISGNYYGSFVGWAIQASAVTTVTVNVGANGFFHMILSEWSGINSADTGGVTSGSSTAGTIPGASIILGDAGDLVIGNTDANGGGPTGPPFGSTQFPSDLSDFNAYELPGAPGAFSFPWPASSSTDYTTATQAFSVVSPSPPAAPSVLYSMRMMP